MAGGEHKATQYRLSDYDLASKAMNDAGCMAFIGDSSEWLSGFKVRSIADGYLRLIDR